MTESILFGEREGWMFSNFASFAIFWRGCLWPTTEHAYQGAKFRDGALIEMIREARSAYDAKKLSQGYKAHHHPYWYDVRVSVMEEIVRVKILQHPYVARKLEETGNRELIENTRRDSFWGNGPDGKGENQLGRILMKLRAEFLAD